MRLLCVTCWAAAGDGARVTIISFGAVLSPIASTLVLLILSEETLLRAAHDLIVLLREQLEGLILPNNANEVVGQHDATNNLVVERSISKHNGPHREAKHH